MKTLSARSDRRGGTAARAAWLPFALAVLAGICAGLAVSLLLPRDYRSQTEIVVVQGKRAAGPGSASRATTNALAELVRSRPVASNVIDALRLRTSPDALLQRIDVKTPQPGILRVAVRDRRAARARQIASQIGLVYPALVQARFKGLRAAVWEPAGKAHRPGVHWLLGALLGALGGALVGLALVLLARPRRGPVGAVDVSADPRERKIAELEAGLAARETELDARAAELSELKRRASHDQAADVDDVERSRSEIVGARAQLDEHAADLERRERERATQGEALDRRQAEVSQAAAAYEQREAALAAREQELNERAAWIDTRGAELAEAERRAAAHAAQLAERERDLESWEAERTARERGLEPVPVAAPPAPPPAEPYVPPPPPPPPPEPPAAPVALSGSSLPELERLVEQHAAARPDRVEEWRYYLLYLRDFAGPGGELPESFDLLVEEIFGDPP